MAIIYQSKNFIVESHDQPEVDREDGGHIKITPITPVVDRAQLTPQQAIELMRLTIVSGKAMVKAMGDQGINIGRINYQDNGNWKPELHVHLYCRAIDAKYQKFGDPIKPGHQPHYQPLTADDIVLVRNEIERLLALEEYSDSSWHL
jgi:diadenosine tetraphosphate (Ap4A) HIT family hydrolase